MQVTAGHEIESETGQTITAGHEIENEAGITDLKKEKRKKRVLSDQWVGVCHSGNPASCSIS